MDGTANAITADSLYPYRRLRTISISGSVTAFDVYEFRLASIVAGASSSIRPEYCHLSRPALGQTRPRRPPPWLAYARPVLLSKRTHFGPVGSWQPWANSSRPRCNKDHRKLAPQARCYPLPSRTAGWSQPIMGACRSAGRTIGMEGRGRWKTMAIAPHEFIRGC